MQKILPQLNVYLITTLTGLLLALSNSAYSHEVCKEVDASGNVTYVDCAMAGESAEEVTIQEPNIVPSTDVPKSNEILDPEVLENEKAKEPPQPSRRELEQQRQRDLEQARKDLEEAKVIRDGDRQATINGNRPTEQYIQRVERAEQKVRELEGKE